MPENEEDVIVTQSGRLAGCRGRVLIAVIALAILLVLLIVILVRGMLSGTPPQPVRRAALDATTESIADAGPYDSIPGQILPS